VQQQRRQRGQRDHIAAAFAERQEERRQPSDAQPPHQHPPTHSHPPDQQPTERINGDLDPDRGREANADRRRLPRPHETPPDQSGGKVAEEDPEEDQKQGECRRGGADVINNNKLAVADLGAREPEEKERIHGPARAQSGVVGVGEQRLQEQNRESGGFEQQPVESAAKAASDRRPDASAVDQTAEVIERELNQRQTGV
jgi:hypothetical protein